jgi:hypothetical protein
VHTFTSLQGRCKASLRLLCLAGVLQVGCGGESSTAPTTPTTPAVRPVTVTGRAVSNPGGTSVGGAQIIDATRRVTLAATDGAGSFSFEYDGASSPIQVSVEAANHLTRVTQIARASHNVTIDLISLAPPFDLTYYQQLARAALNNPTFNVNALGLGVWPRNPNFYLQTNLVDPGQAFRDIGQPVPQEAIDRTVSGIPVIVSEVTGGRLQAGSIEMGPGWLHVNEPGWVTVAFFHRNDNPQTYSGTGGNSGSGTRVMGRVILGVHATRFACPPISQGLIFHEMGHALGLFHIPTVGQPPNMMGGGMGETCDVAHFSSLESFHSTIMYSRPRGNQDPDTDPPDFVF